MIELGIMPPPRAVPGTRTDDRRPELRSDATHLLIQALTAGAGAGAVQTWAAGAVECAAGILARALSNGDGDTGRRYPWALALARRRLAAT